MFQLYLIGGIVALGAIGITIIWFCAKSAGKREEQFKNMQGDLKNGQEVNQIVANNARKPVASIRKRLLNRIKN